MVDGEQTQRRGTGTVASVRAFVTVLAERHTMGVQDGGPRTKERHFDNSLWYRPQSTPALDAARSVVVR